MPEGKFPFRAGPNRRHVPAHSAHRIRRLFFALALLIAVPGGAESLQGAIAEITQDAELYKTPKDASPSHGILPKGTLLRLTGEQEGIFFAVEVELEQGNIEGWVREDRLNLEEQRREQQAAKEKKKTAPSEAKVQTSKIPAAPRRRARLRVPTDESLLLHRETTFYFGPVAGGQWCMIHAFDGTTQFAFSGMGYNAGAQGGFFLRKDLPLRFEATYSNLNGVDPNFGSTPVNFGFFELGTTLGYLVDDFEFFGNVRYAMGISISSLPGALNKAFSGYSSVWVGAGVGYRLLTNDLTNLSARAFYSISFLQNPIGFQTFGLQLVFDLKG